MESETGQLKQKGRGELSLKCHEGRNSSRSDDSRYLWRRVWRRKAKGVKGVATGLRQMPNVPYSERREGRDKIKKGRSDRPDTAGRRAQFVLKAACYLCILTACRGEKRGEQTTARSALQASGVARASLDTKVQSSLRTQEQRKQRFNIYSYPQAWPVLSIVLRLLSASDPAAILVTFRDVSLALGVGYSPGIGQCHHRPSFIAERVKLARRRHIAAA